MAHQVFGTKLNRDTDQRLALLKGLVGALVRSEAIETTEAKAKAVKGLVEEIITKARRGTVSDIRKIEQIVADKDLLHKLVHDIAPRFKTRPGGYTRLIKLGNRMGDNAPMVRMEFVEGKVEAPVVEKAPAKKKTATTPKKKVVRA